MVMTGERGRGIHGTESKRYGERKAFEDVDVYRSQHTRLMI